MAPPPVTPVSLAHRGLTLQVLVHAGAPLDELQRCIAAAFRVDAAQLLALRAPVHHIVYPLSLLTRSPAHFASGTFTLLLERDDDSDSDSESGDHREDVTAAADTATTRTKRRGKAHHHSHHSHHRHRHAKRSERLQRLQEQIQVSRSSSLQRDSSDDNEDENEVDNEDENEEENEFMRELDLTDFELPQLVTVFTQACPTGALDRTTFHRCLEKLLSQVRRFQKPNAYPDTVTGTDTLSLSSRDATIRSRVACLSGSTISLTATTIMASSTSPSS